MGALEGVTVVDLSNFLAGPIASMYLGDFGAEVIKVERPVGGDECRLWGNAKNGVGLFYKVVNRNKKSVTADLHTPLGVEIVRRLIQDADVVVENFRPGTLERWGIGYDFMVRENPGIVLLRISGFGQTGPYRNRPGFGTLAEAYSGYAHISGFPDGPPTLPAFGLADGTTGLQGAFLVLVALEARRKSGSGQVIDLAIYEPLYTLMGPQVIEYDQLGLVQGRNGSRLPFTAPRNTFRTRDQRWVAVSGSGQNVFERICGALNRPELVADPRFSDNRKRIENVEALDGELQSAIGLLELQELLELFENHQAAVAPVNSVADTFEDEQYRSRENIVEVLDEELGRLRFQNVVGKLSMTPGAIHHAGPRLGRDNDEILVRRLGFTADELEAGGLRVRSQPEAGASE